MHATPLLLFGLRHGLYPFEAVLAGVRAAPPWEQDLWHLAPGLDDAQLAALQDMLARIGQDSGVVRGEWLRRGRFSRARENADKVGPHVIATALRVAQGAERDAWISLARACFERTWADENTDVRTRMSVASFALRFAPEAARARHGRTLVDAFLREVDAGFYDQRDIAYAELDPMFDLARAGVSVGLDEDAARVLDDRERRHGAFYQEGEIAEVALIVDDAGEASRPIHLDRFSRWARATRDQGEHEGTAEAMWFLSQRERLGASADERLSQLIASADMAEALYAIVLSTHATPRLRAAAEDKLVDLARTYVATLREVTRDGKVSDFARHAPAVRQLRVAAGALASKSAVVSPALAARIAEVARDWSAWLVTQDVSGDSLPHVYTGIAFAKLAPEITRAASAHLCALGREGKPAVLGYEDWWRLYPQERAIEVAREALAGRK